MSALVLALVACLLCVAFSFGFLLAAVLGSRHIQAAQAECRRLEQLVEARSQALAQCQAGLRVLKQLLEGRELVAERHRVVGLV